MTREEFKTKAKEVVDNEPFGNLGVLFDYESFVEMRVAHISDGLGSADADMPLDEFLDKLYEKIKNMTLEPCEDAVSRQAVLDYAKDTCLDLDEYDDTEVFCDEIKDLPSVEPTQRWIPCSERLPKENVLADGYVEPSDYVLVFGDCGGYGVSRYWGNRKSKAENPNSYKDWIDLDWIAQKPIAWMPLPPSYKGE